MPGETLPEGYKMTKVGVIPEEWKEGPISSIALVNPRTDTSHLKEGSPVSFLPMEKVGEDGTVHAMEVRPYAEVQNGYTIFTDGDILFAKITPCMENGKGALARDLRNGVGFGSTEFHVLRPIDPEDAEFIYQLSRSSSFRNKATRYFTGSAGQQRVSKDIFTHYLCPIPTPEERHRIAAILSAVDAAIAATDEVIAKTEDLKRGLMQDLLTKGIDEAGRVRSEETHAFCEKQGMRVPVEWTGGPISSIAYVNPRTDTSHLKENSPVSFLPMENVGEDGTVHAMEVRPYAEVQNGYTIFTDGDILFAKITPCMENGKGALVRDLENGVGFGSTEFHVLRPVDPEDGEFIYQLSRSSSFRKEATRYFTGSAGQQRVSKDIFTHRFCPIPKPEERPHIATILSTVDRDLATERDHRARLQTLKQGLMQDLLTGRKRVPLDGGEAHGA